MLLLPDREMLLGRMRRRELCHRGWRAAFLGTCICLILYCFGIVETLALYEAGVGALVTAGLFGSWWRLQLESRMLPECFIRLEEKRIMIRHWQKSWTGIREALSGRETVPGERYFWCVQKAIGGRNLSGSIGSFAGSFPKRYSRKAGQREDGGKQESWI